MLESSLMHDIGPGNPQRPVRAQLEPHPLISAERVLAVLSPGSLKYFEMLKRDLLQVLPHTDLIAPRDTQHLGEVVSRSRMTHPVVLAVGGDGTLHQVLQHFDPAQQVLGLLPAGTGNDFARTIGFPPGLAQRIARLSQLSPRPTDFGVLNGIRYHNSAGFGLDAQSLRLRASSRSRLMQSYTLAGLAAIAQLKPMTLEITAGDYTAQGDYYWVLGMNTALIGGGTRIAPQARIDDGCLDMLLVGKAPKLKLALLTPAAVKGQHLGWPFITYRQVPEFTCNASQLVDYIALDGEVYYSGAHTFQFQAQPGAMRFLR